MLDKAKIEYKSLHSTLFILVLRTFKFIFFHSNSTFHSVYISTLLYSYCSSTLSASTFHSVYISTPQRSLNGNQTRSLHSTLFILVPFGRFCGLTKNLSTFHSVYISTINIVYISFQIFHSLHSTLFILVRRNGANIVLTVVNSTFHSVYISTQRLHRMYRQSENSTFHSVYISTYTFGYAVTPSKISTFHSVYISTGKAHLG